MTLSPKLLTLMELVLKQDPKPLTRLVRGKPSVKGREAVGALSDNAKSTDTPLSLTQAVLYLAFDCFDEAHNIAQDHEGTLGNWIHAIVHRREPDSGNSKYWYARVEAPAKVYGGIGGEVSQLLQDHPVPELEPLAKKIAKSKSWEPEAFVDLCEKFRDKDPHSEAYQTLARIQEIEWRALAEFAMKG